MNAINQFKQQWKVYFNRGEGQAIVYGNTENEARIAALAYYRKQKTQMDFCTTDQMIKNILPIA